MYPKYLRPEKMEFARAVVERYGTGELSYELLHIELRKLRLDADDMADCLGLAKDHRRRFVVHRLFDYNNDRCREDRRLAASRSWLKDYLQKPMQMSAVQRD